MQGNLVADTRWSPSAACPWQRSLTNVVSASRDPLRCAGLSFNDDCSSATSPRLTNPSHRGTDDVRTAKHRPRTRTSPNGPHANHGRAAASAALRPPAPRRLAVLCRLLPTTRAAATATSRSSTPPPAGSGASSPAKRPRPRAGNGPCTSSAAACWPRALRLPLSLTRREFPRGLARSHVNCASRVY